MFNTIENFNNTAQYYWIPKILNTEFSILLNTENIEYRIFNITEYRKNFQYRCSIIPKKKLNKNPRPSSFPARTTPVKRKGLFLL